MAAAGPGVARGLAGVCLTGSNASLLGREMGSNLTGRQMSHEVYPFSFREFLEFTGQPAGPTELPWIPDWRRPTA